MLSWRPCCQPQNQLIISLGLNFAISCHAAFSSGYPMTICSLTATPKPTETISRWLQRKMFLFQAEKRLSLCNKRLAQKWFLQKLIFQAPFVVSMSYIFLPQSRATGNAQHNWISWSLWLPIFAGINCTVGERHIEFLGSAKAYVHWFQSLWVAVVRELRWSNCLIQWWVRTQSSRF